LAARAGYLLDSLIGVFSPRAALDRMNARDIMIRARMYAAAKPTGDAGNWIPYDGDVNSLIRSSSQQVRARVRQLVRDFPYAKRAQAIRNALIIGNGIRLQARLAGPDGTMDRAANEAIENAFADWAQKASIDEKMTFANLQTLADKQDFECGEYFFVKRYLRGKKHPLRLQPIEADRLLRGQYTGRLPDTVEVQDGIEYEIATGKVLAYHIEDDGYRYKVVRVPADLVIHGYEMERPGQLRGISPIASAVMVAGNLADLLDAELEAMRMASRYLGFVQSNDIPGFQAANKPKNKKGEDERRLHTEYLDHATLQYLRTGDTVTLAKMDRQSGTFEPYLRFNIRTFSIGAGLTYELVSGDYDKISYSNLRGIRLDLATILKPIQRSRVDQFCRPVAAAWLEAGLLTDRSLMPFARRITPAAYRWIVPGMASPDPLKEIKAKIDEINGFMATRHEYCAERGLVFEEVVTTLADEKKTIEDAGLTITEVDTALKNNPAALMDENGEENDAGTAIAA
jgi:lambda family phage portal protein